MRPLLASFWDTANRVFAASPFILYLWAAAVLRDAIGLSARSGHSVSKALREGEPNDGPFFR